MIQLRDYQEESVHAVYGALQAGDGHPVIVIPTGGGKTPVIAQLCADAVTLWNGRVLVLAHVKELLEQTAGALRAMCPTVPVGVYSAGLKRRDTHQPVIVAGIQSVYDKADTIGRFDLVIVDEAHLIPPDGDGMYLTLLTALKEANPELRVIGLTATPYRLGTGLIYSDGGVLTEVCYEVGVKHLVNQGYLCPLVGKAAVAEVSTRSLKIVRGEFDEKQAETLFTAGDVVRDAVREVVDRTVDRRSVLLFCQTVAHGNRVTAALRADLVGREELAARESDPARDFFALDADPLADHRLGVVYDWLIENGHPVDRLTEWMRRGRAVAGEIYGDTSSEERAALIQRFRAGSLRYLVNVGVLTTGFDAPNVDCVCLLRATVSPGLYYQIVGRGFRLHPDKKNCLVLDFGENIKRHGPVDQVKVDGKKKSTEGEPVAKMCPECRTVVAGGVSVCPDCNYVWPVEERTPAHGGTADDGDPLSTGKPKREEHEVLGVTYRPHTKKDAPPGHPKTLRVTYRLGVGEAVSEWVCVEHTGFAGEKARKWWAKRCAYPMPRSAVEAAVYAGHGLLAAPVSLTLETKPKEKYPEVKGVEVGDKPTSPDPCPGCGAVNLRGILPSGDFRHPGRVVCQECDHQFGYADPDTCARYGFVTDPGRDFGGMLPLEYERSGAATECPECGACNCVCGTEAAAETSEVEGCPF
jgi:DNA repair protein RadD